MQCKPSNPDRSDTDEGSTVDHIAKLEEKIEAIESKIGEIEAQLADPETYKDHSKFSELQDEHEKLKKELEPYENEWASRG